ncbi:hypothetical protein [Hymenobacter sp. APR13]|uniref:hypothetical protein n=1 Tax=Hymenobacter sp. APR13 TaxID=1356852 RepID=UPI000B01D73B|nr:hypothetical protein [Hymenobacter sp. APR13]
MNFLGKDLLADWKERVGVKKFKLAKPLDSPYKHSIDIEKSLRNFFNISDYTIGTKRFDDENYLVYLLSSTEDHDIYQLKELAELIEYAKVNAPHIPLKSKKGLISHVRLSQFLFEVYMDKFLKQNSIDANNTMSYVDSKGNIRPMDNYFEFLGSKYLVECCRVDEPINKSILQLSEYLVTSLAKNKIHDYKMYRGHIGFKTEKSLSKSIDRAKGVVIDLYKKYMHSFNTKGLTIFIPKKYECDDFDIDIMPYYLGTSHEQEVKKSSYRTLISFHAEANSFDLSRGQIIISGMKTQNVSEINQKLFNKVQGKINQHSDAPSDYNRIIFIEIDITKGHSPNTPMFSPIDKENINYDLFDPLINNKTGIIFIFKEANETGIHRVMNTVCPPNYKPLIDYLSKRNNK